MKKWVIIGTWRMAFEGISKVVDDLSKKETATNAVIKAIKEVEDYPFYKSVGYGGLPNNAGVVELDAAFMDGNTLAIGAVAAIKDFESPIEIAYALSCEKFNSFMVGVGAENYALEKGFKRKKMLSDRALKLYEQKLDELEKSGLSPYDGHDTVCILAQDNFNNIVAGTSTSGLFMKKPGRVGDSPISGSGFYADSDYGAAAATGLGEDIMKTCVSFETVQNLKRGMNALEAVQKAVNDASLKLKNKFGRVGDMSVICISKNGDYGVATTTEFSYVVANENNEINVFLVNENNEHSIASKEWLEAYYLRTHKDLN